MSRRSSSAIAPSAESGWGGETGAAFAALLASLTVMLIVLGAAAPTWHYVVQNEKEQELLFRGLEIVRALRAHQKFMSGLYPPALDNLVAGKYMRRLYRDPMVPDGKWQLIRRGQPLEGCPQFALPSIPGGQPAPPPPPPPPPPEQPGGPPTVGGEVGTVGEIIGVRSQSRDESIRVFGGRNHYNEWCFVADTQGALGTAIPESAFSIEQLVGVKAGEQPPPFTGQHDGYLPRDWNDHPPLREY
jgi:hypothetical protein